MNIVTKAALLYADAHAPWPWQRRLHQRLAEAYATGALNALAMTQIDQALMQVEQGLGQIEQAMTNPVHHTPPGEPNVPPPVQAPRR